jgi:hypothetical protein
MKILILYILFAFAFTLTACDFGGEDLYDKAKQAENEQIIDDDDDDECTGDDFTCLSPEEIAAIPLSTSQIDGSDATNDLPDGTIVVYLTNEGRYGKLQVITWGYNLTIKWVTYDFDYSIYSSGDSLEISGTWSCDLDAGLEVTSSPERDFFWEQVSGTERYLTPQNGAEFALY